MNKMLRKLINISVKERYASLIVTIMTLICLGACSPKHSSYSEFKEIRHEGWLKFDYVEFVPTYGDSLGVYDVSLSFCFAHNYPYRNICAVVDFMKNDSIVKRLEVEDMLTDENGNWQTSGFGVAYQSSQELYRDVHPGDFDKIRVWQGLNCDTLKCVTRVGITVQPTKNR